MKTPFIFILALYSVMSYGQNHTVLLDKCEAFYMLGQQDSVRKYAILGLNLIESKKDDKSIFQFFLANANMCTYPDSSFKTLNVISKEFQNRNHNKYLSFIHTAFGGYYRKVGNFDEAFANYKKAIVLAEKYFGQS